MQALSKPIILTRTQAQSEDFAKALRQSGTRDLDIRIHPLLAIRYIAFDPPRSYKHLVFTSPHGVHAWCRQSNWRGAASVVGAQSAYAARKAGFSAITQFNQLHEITPAALGDGAHYIRGAQISCPLAVAQTIAYEQLSLPWSAPPPPKRGAIFPVFSYHSARRIVDAGLIGANIHPIAISTQAAKPLQNADMRVTIAPSADRKGMIDAVLKMIGQNAKSI